MAHGILSLPTWLVGFVLVVVLPALVLLLQWGIRRWWPFLAEGEHNDVVGFIIAVVGVVYAVLLGFVVIVTWEEFTTAESIVDREASTLRSLYRESVAFPAETREEVHDLVRRYAAEVVESEWPAMADAEPGSSRVGDVLDGMTAAIASVPVTTPTQQEFVGAEAQRLSELVELRGQRLDYADRGIPAVLWVALVVGGVVTVGFAMLFGLQRAALHSLMVSSLAALVGVIFFVALMVNYPFAGGLAVDPEPFERVLVDFSP